MLPDIAHTETEQLNRELREIELSRPRLERPDPRRRSRMLERFRARIVSPAKATRSSDGIVQQVKIRPAAAADARDLARLAEMSERRVPSGLVLVAEVESRIVAAMPVEGGHLLTDLWRPTGDVVQLLELRKQQLRVADAARRAA